MRPEMECELVDGTVTLLDTSCVCCNTRMRGRPARAVILRRPTQFPETADRVWLLSRNSFSVVHKLCRARTCRGFLENPVLPPAPHRDALLEDSISHRRTMRFLAGTVIEKPWPVRQMRFFEDERSLQMQHFVKDTSKLRAFCEYVDERDQLRCVGAWSCQEEIDAAHHYACLFAQESYKESGIWMPYWFRDARLIGTNRVTYLVKGAESYHGAVMVDTLGYSTLAWVWLTPRLRRRGIFRLVWRSLENYHRGFKVLAPLSAAMRAFLRSEDAEGLHEIVTETECTK
jgi:hypothetical protein